MRLGVIRSPSTYRFNGNFVFWHPIFSVGHITGKGNCYAMHHRVETANFMELGLKLYAPLFQQPYIGLTVRQQFVLEIKNVSFGYFLVVPFVEFFFSLRGHPIGVVVGFFWHVPLVDLVLVEC